MSSSLTARLPQDIAVPLSAYCADAGLSRTEVVVNALREYLARHKPRPTAYELALPLIPARGLPHIQARDARRILHEKIKVPSGGR